MKVRFFIIRIQYNKVKALFFFFFFGLNEQQMSGLEETRTQLTFDIFLHQYRFLNNMDHVLALKNPRSTFTSSKQETSNIKLKIK